ncbi:hypothetical protein GBAR_LOCUS12217, partial [Geodia barretti]
MCAEEAMCGIIDWFTWGPLAEVSGREQCLTTNTYYNGILQFYLFEATGHSTW